MWFRQLEGTSSWCCSQRTRPAQCRHLPHDMRGKMFFQTWQPFQKGKDHRACSWRLIVLSRSQGFIFPSSWQIILGPHQKSYKTTTCSSSRISAWKSRVRDGKNSFSSLDAALLQFKEIIPLKRHTCCIWKGIVLVEQVQRRASKMTGGMEHLSYNGRL